MRKSIFVLMAAVLIMAVPAGSQAAKHAHTANLCGPKAVHFHDYVGCVSYNHRIGWVDPDGFCRRICQG